MSIENKKETEITQDSKIQKLIALVQQKKGEIGKIENQQFKTNCQFTAWPDTKVINIQVITNSDELVHILSYLHSRKASWEHICLTYRLNNVFNWQGYSYDHWVNDIMNRINKLSLSAKRKELETLEGRLEKLVSPELRARIELELIEKELGL